MELDVHLIVLPVFLVIGLGFVLKRVGLVGTEFLFQLNRLIYYVALPGLLFYKISTSDFSASFNGSLLLTLVGTTLAIFFGSLIFSWLRPWPGTVRGAFVQGAFRGNLAYIGLAIVFNAFGESGFTIAGILLGFLVPLYNLLSVIGLSLAREGSEAGIAPASLIRQVLANPLILASFAGICWSYLGLPVPMVADRALHIVTGMSLPLALISIGASFSFKKLRGDIWVAGVATLVKIVVTPAVAALFLYHLGVRGEELGVAILLAATPTATAAYILAQQMDSDAELSGAIIMLSTLCSLASYSGWLYLLQMLQ